MVSLFASSVADCWFCQSGQNKGDKITYFMLLWKTYNNKENEQDQVNHGQDNVSEQADLST